MQVYSCRKLAESQEAIAISHAHGAMQSVCVHVYLELGKLHCNAAVYIEILCAPCCSEMRERHRCYC